VTSQDLTAAILGRVDAYNPELHAFATLMRGEALAGRRDVTVAQAVLGNDAGILGAAAMSFDEHDAREGMH